LCPAEKRKKRRYPKRNGPRIKDGWMDEIQKRNEKGSSFASGQNFSKKKKQIRNFKSKNKKRE
jgi:hypothetical protein